MAKNSIPDYSATAASNTDIQSVNIDEGCAPSGINNAIRELMVDLKNMDTGTVALTSPQMTSVDINGGTVDGVTLGTNSAVTEAQVDNININGNTVSSTNINGDVNLSPNGTGTVVINTDLDVDNININGNTIISTDTNGNIALTPNGTGEVDISKVDIDSGAIDGTTIGASSAAAGSFTTVTTSGVSATGALTFTSSASERMRIDGTSLFVGKTSASLATTGIQATSSGQAFSVTRDGGGPFNLNRLTSDGEVAGFYKDTSQFGSIASNGGAMDIISTSSILTLEQNDTARRRINFQSTDFAPRNADDDTMDLGKAAARWDDVYATNGTIQTSDANEKQDIEALSDAEQRVAVAAKGLLRKYRWKSSVAEKGDDARIHFGIIAQDLKAAFEAEGLDAGRYAMFINSEWWEHSVDVPAVEADPENDIEAVDAYTRVDTYSTQEEAPEGAVKRSRMGVRYNQLLAFIIAAI